MKPSDYLDFSHTRHAALFVEGEPVWSVLAKIGDYLKENLQPAILGEVSEKATVGPDVFIGEGTVVEPGAVIKGPAWIGKNCVVRSGAYVRENVITGDGCTLGNSCEFKNCVLFDNAEVPHFNYVGDAILGYKAHLGAGVILSNVRLDRGEVVLQIDGERVGTGLKKFSAVIGDHAEIGCNSVISPGSLIGPHCIVYPCVSFSGVLPASSILKLRQEHVIVPRRSA
ncbi:UDP-N-acetylglucosamine diphosphorylase [Phragmitibacter flavus]|uniref:UDP-N-acetylglucosamine diphosphorylase n=1 Tax=Phragmitibacter flavus TaxID=2576071 RepID=A0A5R8KLX6_9BACT|nr:UDP-N-acetylglucosamine diphosphorylase [Phragmitibacter flavus]TLD72799.1 UDP-N-acetylglucosamine diphosphorylase [Phragmitibacter flavus]